MRNQFLFVCTLFFREILCQSNSKPLGFKLSPKVTAECSNTNMFVYLDTQDPFPGIINARGHRDSCFTLGDGISRRTVLIIPLMSNPTDPVYCGQERDITTGDYKVYVDVHAHKILEVENDKTFLVSCSQNGMLGEGFVHLSLVQPDGRDANRTVQDEPYTLRITYSNATLHNQNLDVRNCVAFGRGNATQALSDDRGCPTANSPLGRFKSDGPTSEASLTSMLRFQDTSQVHLQCEVGLCRSPCPKVLCPGDQGYDPSAAGASQKIPRANGDGQALAGSTITVLEPGSRDGAIPVTSSCGYGEWVLALCITFGILFLIMLIVNIIMCSAVSCNCTQKEQTEEVHHDAWGEYDTVKNAWSSSMSGGSIPGDRHSLHSVPVGVTSQYQPRGPSPYYNGHRSMHDDGDIRDVRSAMSVNPHGGYGDHYAMVHRNGTNPKY